MWATGVDRFARSPAGRRTRAGPRSSTPRFWPRSTTGSNCRNRGRIRIFEVGFEFVAVPPETTEEHVLGGAEEKQEPENGRQHRGASVTKPKRSNPWPYPLAPSPGWRKLSSRNNSWKPTPNRSRPILTSSYTHTNPYRGGNLSLYEQHSPIEGLSTGFPCGATGLANVDCD